MSNLKHLYQEMILEHNRNPRNFKLIDAITHHSHGLNPLCGDDYYLFLRVKEGVIEDISFKGMGCAISKSSGSMMTNMLKGKSLKQATKLKDAFLELLTKETPSPEIENEVGRLKVFSGVKEFPVRVKCATLIWRALEDALSNKSNDDHTVTTE